MTKAISFAVFIYLLSGIEITSYALALTADPSMCPVMTDKVGKEKYTVEYKGKKYLLCCKSCVKKFNKNPEKYTR